MTSQSQIAKVAAARATAPLELPMARLCSDVVLAHIEYPDDSVQLERLIGLMKVELGSNWSRVTAFQFMSGMRGEFAAECAPESERERLLAAHRIANEVCNSQTSVRLALAALG